MSNIDATFIRTLVDKATNAANEAGEKWMAEAEARGPKYAVMDAPLFGTPVDTGCRMLDLCGNAHVRFKDKRSSWFKAFKKVGAVRATESGVVEIWHKWKPRQEHGLQMACAEAAMKVLTEAGVTGLRIWDYID